MNSPKNWTLTHFVFLFFSVTSFQLIQAQVSFTDQTALLTNTNHFSGVAIAISDMNGDGLDDIIRYDQGKTLNIEYQTTPNNAFTNYVYGDVHTSSEWGTCIADFDKNGFNDIAVGGLYDNIKLLHANNSGSSYLSSILPNSAIFLQGSNFVDINNDGWADIYACHDDAESRKYRNNQNATFTEDAALMYTTLPSGNSGNYASIWTDYDNDGDQDMYLSKCRGGVSDPTDPRRINLLFQNNGNHEFSEVGALANLRIGDQSWATDFADIDNDGDLDCFVLNHSAPSLLLENQGDGTFTDITIGSGINISFTGIQTLFRDFDNDGLVDLIVTGTQHELYLNNGNKTFTSISNPFSSNEIESLAIGDLNNDGYLDIYAGYANLFTSPSNIPDQLWINDGGNNNSISVILQGIESNTNGIGARIEIYGSWGVQIREVRSGEGYGIHNSLSQHFGLGQANNVNSIVVKWPSGKVDILENYNPNQPIKVVEGSSPGCIAALVINSKPIPNGLFEANEEVYSTGRIETNSNVIFEAAQQVTLDNGFEVEFGGEFKADIAPCDN